MGLFSVMTLGATAYLTGIVLLRRAGWCGDNYCVCSQCGYDVRGSRRTCPECGIELSGNVEWASRRQARKGRSLLGGTLVVIGTLVLAPYLAYLLVWLSDIWR